VDEAFMCGQSAVREAIRGTTGQMITLVRVKNSPYVCKTGTAKLSDVANGESVLPRDFMDESGTHISKKFYQYLAPLVQGEVKVPMGKDGLPMYPRLKRKLLDKKCGEWKK
jgi:6-phosphofructokinase 1